MDWFQWEIDITSGSDFERNLDRTMHMLEEHEDEGWKELFISLLTKLDIMDDFELDESNTSELSPDHTPKEYRVNYSPYSHEHANVTVKRKFYDGDEFIGIEKFDLMGDESEGTRKLFAFMGAVLGTLKRGGVLVVDELELKLHPLITQTIIELFNSNESNNNVAQLIFTTHDTNLLNNRYFRRDQIWFVEKSNRGSSHLFSLAEYKPRKDASYSKDYVLGKYGAIPYIGDIRYLAKSKQAK
jgi:hypothetical protein